MKLFLFRRSALKNRGLRCGWRRFLCGLGVGLAGMGEGSGVETKEELLDLSLAELTEVRVDTVYAASRSREKIRDAPASVTIVTRDEIRKFGYRTLADVARSVRGFDVTDDRNYSYTGIRGYAGLGDYGSHVLLLVDGHRMNDPIYDVVAVGTDGLLDLDLIERVEFIRGPASMYYGSNTFSGAINVVTRSGASVNGVESSVRAGTYETGQARVTGGGKGESGLDYLWSISHYTSRGPRSLYYADYDQKENNGGVAQNLDGDRFWSGLVKLSHGDFTFQGGYVTRDKDVPTGSFGSVFNRSSTTLDSRGYAELRYAHTSAGQWETSARLYFDSYDYDGISWYDLGGPDLRANNDSLTARWWGVEGGLSRDFGKVRLSAGVEYRHGTDMRQLNYDEDPNTRIFAADSKYEVMGGYIDTRWKWNETLSLSTGVRLDHYDSFGVQWSPRTALNWKPDDRTTFKLLYGEAFGGPNLYQLEYQTADHRANPGLEPETIQSAELAAAWELTPHLKLSGSLFRNELNDLIQEETAGNGGSVFRNSGDAQVIGAELEVEGRFSNGALVRLSGTRQDSESRSTGRTLLNSPENVWKAHLAVPVFRQRAHAGLEVLYSSGRETLLRQTTADAWQVNFTLYSREILPGLDVSASIYNLLDQEYAFPGGPEHRQDILRQNGRTFGIHATWHF